MKRSAFILALIAMVICLGVSGSSAAPDKAKPSDDRIAKARLTTKFEKTKTLLNYLEQRNPTLHGQLIQVGHDLESETEAQALKFAKNHHPELAKLLELLKQKNPRAFASAMHTLLNETNRLNRVRSKTPNQHELALEAWKARSRARLLAAHMRRNESPGDETKLRSLLALEEAAIRKQTSLQRARIQESLARADSKLKISPEEAIDSQLKKLRKAISRKSNKSKKKTD